MSDLSISDQLIHTTVRLGTVSKSGTSGSGTGFITRLCEAGDRHIPVIVTNWHVVEGTKQMHFCMTMTDDAGKPKYGSHETVVMDDPESMWARHPNYPEVDLAVLPIAPVLSMFSNKGLRPFFRSFDAQTIADESFFNDLVAVEDVLMIGYPSGLWDDQNNLPIVRRGITATPPAIAFTKRRQFVIDCACFPGSSGSPVVLYNAGGFVSKNGGMMLGNPRVKLLGVLYAGPRYTAEGEIKIIPDPTAAKAVSLSPMHINLGYCIRATEIKAFEVMFAPFAPADKIEPPTSALSSTPTSDNEKASSKQNSAS